MLNQNLSQASITEATTIPQLEGLLKNGIANKEITPELGSTLLKIIQSNGVVANPSGGSSASLLPISVGQVTFPTTGVSYSMGVNGYYTFVTPYNSSKYSTMGSYFDLNGNGQPIWYSGVRNTDYTNADAVVIRENDKSFAEIQASFESNSGFDIPSIDIASSADTTSVGGVYRYDNRISLNADNILLERINYIDNTRNIIAFEGAGGIQHHSIDISTNLKQVTVFTNSISHSVICYINFFQSVCIVEYSLKQELNSGSHFASTTHRLPVAASNAIALAKFGNNQMYLDENTGVVKISCPVYANTAAAIADFTLQNYSNFFNSSTNKYEVKINP